MLIISICLKKMIHLKTWLLLIAGFCLSCLSPVASSQTIWQGKTGGFNIHWSQTDITAAKDGKVVFSAEEALARKYFEREYLDWGFLDRASENFEFLESEHTLTLLSVVDTIASIKDGFEEHRRVLVSGSPTKITTINLANPDQVVSLTDFFGESVILKALLADPLIQKALAKVDTTTPPSTLDALYQVLSKAPSIVVRTEDDCQFHLTEDFLTRFAFHHIDKERVAVRIALESTALGCLFEYVQLGIYLPIPDKLKLALKKAQKGQAGFLMNNLKKIAKEQQTNIYFARDTYMPYPAAGTRMTTVSNARLRTLPKVTNSDIVTTLKKGTILKTLARTSFQEDSRRYHRDYWYLVELENGKIGWIFGALTKRLEKAPLTSPRKTTAKGVRVRSAPNLKASIIETLDKGGTIVHVFARSKRQDKIGDLVDYWYQVHLDRDKTGWIFGGLLMETDVIVGSHEKISDLRSAFTIYGRSKHQEKIGGILDYWYQVGESKMRNLGEPLEVPTGWVFGGDTMRIGPKTTMTSGVRMRSKPSIKASLVNTLKKGVVVYAIARSTHQNKIAGNLDYWYQVKSVDGNIGWVFGGLLMSISFSEMSLYTTLEVDAIQETYEKLEETGERLLPRGWPEIRIDCGGTEPFWNLTLSPVKGVRYRDTEGQVIHFPIFSFLDVSSNNPSVWSLKAKESKANGKSVVLFLHKDRCSDGMSDNEYKYHIFVRLHDDRVFSGCCN